MASSPVTIHEGQTMAKQLIMQDGAPWDTQGVILGSVVKRTAAYILDLFYSFRYILHVNIIFRFTMFNK